MRERAVRWHPLPGGRLATVEFGDPEGPVALVVPGLSDGLAPLSDPDARRAVPRPPPALRTYRVLVVSHRHPLPPGPTTADLAADLAHLLDAEGAGPAVVAGHSMGSMVALHLAARRPDLVRSLVLSAATARADERLVRRLRRWEDLLRAGEVRRFLQDSLAVSYTGSELARRRLVVRLWPPPDVADRIDRHLALSAACRTHDASELLASIAAPALVLAGEADRLVHPDRTRAVAEAIPTSRYVCLPRVAHGFPEQARSRYVRELTAWLGAGAGPVAR